MNSILKLAQQIKDAEGVTLAAVIEKVEKIRVDEEMSQKDIKKLAQALVTLKNTVDGIPLDSEVKKLKTAISDATERVSGSLSKEIGAVRNELKATEVRLLEEMVARIPDIVTVTEKVTEVAKELDEQEQKKVLDKVLDPVFVAKVRDVIESFEADERLDASKLKNLPEMQTLKVGGGGSNLTVYKDGVQVNSSTRLNFVGSGVAVTTEAGGTKVTISGSGGGYTNLTEFVDQTPHRVFYSNGSGDVTELALGADGTFLKSNGATSAPSFATPAGAGDVSKVGTPVNNQIGVWTGDGTIEGDANFTFDTTTDTLSTVTITASGNITGANLSGTNTGDVTVSDSSEIDLTLTGQQISASIVASSIDESKLDASVNASLDKADSASQPGHTHAISDITSLQTTLDGKQDEAVIVSGSLTAANDTYYVNVASATYTDPSPTEGRGFIVFVRNGTATVGGTGYSTAGTIIQRIYHSGAWSNYTYNDSSLFAVLSGGNTFSGSQVFSDATADRIAIFGASKNLQVASTTTYPSLTELAYVKGVTSAIQTQLNAKYQSGDSPTFATVTTTGNIELGNASDTTLSRSAAGVLAVEGKRVVTRPENFFIKAITIESPTASEDLTLFYTDEAITITQISAVSVGSSPSVTYTIRHSTDRSATGNEVVTSGSTTTSTTTGNIVTSFNDATIPADSWVWLETSSVSGTVTNVNISVEYTVD